MSAIHAFGEAVPPRAIIGLIGLDHSAISRGLMGVNTPATFLRSWTSRVAGNLLLVDWALDRENVLTRLRGERALNEARRSGSSVLIATSDEVVLGRLCDEIWWIEDGGVKDRGDPGVILARWRSFIANRWYEEQSGTPRILPVLHGGDGRAAIRSLELLNASGQPVLSWKSGEEAEIRASIEYRASVPAPVIGILIRTRIGLNVYGTNTELEGITVSPCSPGDILGISFRFRCELCPNEYTLTIASHDPDGTWHEWLEDAMAFSVIDTRFTAGVANLRARVDWRLTTRPDWANSMRNSDNEASRSD